MTLLSSSFLLLTAILNNTLYINHPYSAQAVFACFDDICYWSSNWSEMQPYQIENYLPALTVDLPINATQYKLRIIYPNRTVGDTSWIQIPQQQQQQQQQSTENVIFGLLYYISVIVSVLFVKAILSYTTKCSRPVCPSLS